jgi:nucleotide-binding universal stress UspA family protein
MKILLAYVPSATSEAALAFAVQEARAHDACLVVVASSTARDPRKAQGVTDRRPLAERLAEFDVPFEMREVDRRDDPADDILTAIEEEHVDRAVLGVRRRTPIGKFILGSTSQRVLMEAKCPVTCVKPEGMGTPTV